MLTDHDLTVGEIAHALDYSGSNNFVRAFQRISGITPGQYRHSSPQGG